MKIGMLVNRRRLEGSMFCSPNKRWEKKLGKTRKPQTSTTKKKQKSVSLVFS
jgi:hypothetical protein